MKCNFKIQWKYKNEKKNLFIAGSSGWRWDGIIHIGIHLLKITMDLKSLETQIKNESTMFISRKSRKYENCIKFSFTVHKTQPTQNLLRFVKYYSVFSFEWLVLHGLSLFLPFNSSIHLIVNLHYSLLVSYHHPFA